MKSKAGSPAQVRQSLQLAGALLGRGDVTGAERTLRRLLQTQPPCAAALDLLSAIANAEREVCLTIAYFVPDPRLLKALADAAARTVIAPQLLPVGVLTALIGVPVFLFLLNRRA
jgi:phosphatidylserine/phosphatidylglycerophosphate/cardiolipin synthase-like enzyme